MSKPEDTKFLRKALARHMSAIAETPSGPIAVPCQWLLFNRTHPRNETCEKSCVIHNPTPHHMQHWALHWRADRGIFERICPCGIGHPDPDQHPYWDSTGRDHEKIHGCCGCCKENK